MSKLDVFVKVLGYFFTAIICLVGLAWLVVVTFYSGKFVQWFVNSFMNPAAPLTLKFCIWFIVIIEACIGIVSLCVWLDDRFP